MEKASSEVLLWKPAASLAPITEEKGPFRRSGSLDLPSRAKARWRAAAAGARRRSAEGFEGAAGVSVSEIPLGPLERMEEGAPLSSEAVGGAAVEEAAVGEAWGHAIQSPFQGILVGEDGDGDRDRDRDSQSAGVLEGAGPVSQPPAPHFRNPLQRVSEHMSEDEAGALAAEAQRSPDSAAAAALGEMATSGDAGSVGGDEDGASSGRSKEAGAAAEVLGGLPGISDDVNGDGDDSVGQSKGAGAADASGGSGSGGGGDTAADAVHRERGRDRLLSGTVNMDAAGTDDSGGAASSGSSTTGPSPLERLASEVRARRESLDKSDAIADSTKSRRLEAISIGQASGAGPALELGPGQISGEELTRAREAAEKSGVDPATLAVPAKLDVPQLEIPIERQISFQFSTVITPSQVGAENLGGIPAAKAAKLYAGTCPGLVSCFATVLEFKHTL